MVASFVIAVGAAAAAAAIHNGPYARGAAAGQMTGRGVMNFVDKDGDEFHGFEEGGVPEEEVGEEVA